MTACKSRRHTWTDPISGARCCNGWHRELRPDGPEPGDDPEGRVAATNLPGAPRAAFVWVRDEPAALAVRSIGLPENPPS